ncbi:MAG: hypothetical protein V3U98_10755 [Acidobacteriota bacterium]
MSPEPVSCLDLGAAWPGFDPAEPLPGWALAHLRGCARCRSNLGPDPSRLFAVLRGTCPEPVPAWRALPEEAVARRLQRLGQRRLRQAWALAGAAALLLAATLWLLRPGAGEPLGEPPGHTVAEAVSPPGPEPGPAAAEILHAGALPTLESIASPAAQVVEFRIFGREDQVTEVILIFDEEIEL